MIAFYLLRPALPYLEYVIRKEHIEKYLCIQKDNPENTCHGKCYLHNQLNKQNEHRDTDSEKDKIVPERKMDDHLQAASVIPGTFITKLTVRVSFKAPVTVSYTPPIFVPPKI